MQAYQDYIHISKYARYLDEFERRESWPETVQRYVTFWTDRYPDLKIDWEEIKQSILKYEVMPSMRALMTAGKALDDDNMAGFNCAGAGIDTPRIFDEAFYILMCGTGIGFSVERKYIRKLPEINDEMHDTDTVIVVKDSKIGWARALKELIAMLYTGNIPKWDLSKVRQAGARLKTFGGRASGPEPLDKLFHYTVGVFKTAKGTKLTSIQCHDLMCMIAKTVIVGSVRRSACISFSNLSDDRMRRAKNGNWQQTNPERHLSNNSVMYTCKPDLYSYMEEFKNLFESKSGERGICNQKALITKAASCGRTKNYDGWFVLNPCGEAILRSTGGLCNLSEIVARFDDTRESLMRKARVASILGTLQSTLTNFRYVRKVWKTNAEEDRLLGVSITGVMDNAILNGMAEWANRNGGATSPFVELASWLRDMKVVVKDTNIEFAEMLGVSPATQLTLIKPSGTVSQLVNSSSGMHPRHFRLINRKVAQDPKDPLSLLMMDQGVPYYKSEQDDKLVFEFPIKPPENSIIASDIDPIYQLELWKVYHQEWCDGNPSQTIFYDDDSFLDVQAWVYKNWDDIGGLSFFPLDNNVYPDSPFNDLTTEEYEKRLEEFPVIDFSQLHKYEDGDQTTSSQELACHGDKCII